jgi:transposase
MLTDLSSISKVYLACESVDMRKSINGLSIIVQETFELDPFVGALYVFTNSSCNKVKILKWDQNGFWLYYKRLEKGKFFWPKIKGNKIMAIKEHELRWLLDGLSLQETKGFDEVKERGII